MLPVDWLRRFRGLCATDQPLAPLTTWGLGGPAQLYVEPADTDELAETLRLLRRLGIPFRILGGGSNLLVSDRGVRGAVVSLARLARIEAHADGTVSAEAGARLHRVVTFAANRGLEGLESLVGIPGRVGGAVFGNSGSKYGAIGDAVTALDLLEPDGTLTHVVPNEFFFRYRGSNVGDRVVVRAHLAVGAGEPRVLRARIRELIAERRSSQPGWNGNAGCVFRNPEGLSAGRLIDEAGGKRLRVGKICVSRIHANFFLNEGGGTEGEVQRLVHRVRERVREVHGIELEWEVRRWA
ncbi:MAG: UDP-N-acetylmuramate dehydrogenase [Planctomycetota bacterium]|jgi:UDP-N-acetylmuramate dehydrogenase